MMLCRYRKICKRHEVDWHFTRYQIQDYYVQMLLKV